MKILLTNDDGYQAIGIRTLAKELSKTHEIYFSIKVSLIILLITFDTLIDTSEGLMQTQFPAAIAPIKGSITS